MFPEFMPLKHLDDYEKVDILSALSLCESMLDRVSLEHFFVTRFLCNYYMKNRFCILASVMGLLAVPSRRFFWS